MDPGQEPPVAGNAAADLFKWRNEQADERHKNLKSLLLILPFIWAIVRKLTLSVHHR
jgi:hypothetical protein